MSGMEAGPGGSPGGPSVVTRAMWLDVLGFAEQVPVTLRWSAREPYAVVLWFPGADNYGRARGVHWRVARDVLAEGLRGPVGLGDVSVLPDLTHLGHVELILSSPDGVLGLRVPVRLLQAFLLATWQVVPAGREVMPEPPDYFTVDHPPEAY